MLTRDVVGGARPPDRSCTSSGGAWPAAPASPPDASSTSARGCLCRPAPPTSWGCPAAGMLGGHRPSGWSGTSIPPSPPTSPLVVGNRRRRCSASRWRWHTDRGLRRPRHPQPARSDRSCCRRGTLPFFAAAPSAGPGWSLTRPPRGCSLAVGWQTAAVTTAVPGLVTGADRVAAGGFRAYAVGMGVALGAARPTRRQLRWAGPRLVLAMAPAALCGRSPSPPSVEIAGGDGAVFGGRWLLVLAVGGYAQIPWGPSRTCCPCCAAAATSSSAAASRRCGRGRVGRRQPRGDARSPRRATPLAAAGGACGCSTPPYGPCRWGSVPEPPTRRTGMTTHLLPPSRSSPLDAWLATPTPAGRGRDRYAPGPAATTSSPDRGSGGRGGGVPTGRSGRGSPTRPGPIPPRGHRRRRRSLARSGDRALHGPTRTRVVEGLIVAALRIGAEGGVHLPEGGVRARDRGADPSRPGVPGRRHLAPTAR